MFNFLKTAFATIQIALLGFLGVPQVVDQPDLGATIPTVVAKFETSLADGITPTATSMTLVRGTDTAGNSLSGYYCFTVDSGSPNEEFVCGTASGTAVTSMIRGVSPTDGDLEVSSLKKSHRLGAAVKITNHPIEAILARLLNGSESLPNVIKYDSDKTFSTSTELVSKKYVDDTAFAGAPDATESQKGILELSTKSELAAGTDTGDTTAKLTPRNSFFNATPSATTTVPVTGSDGKLDQGFLDLSDSFAWTGQHSFASSTVVNAPLTASSTFTVNGSSIFNDPVTFNDTTTFNVPPAGLSLLASTSTNVTLNTDAASATILTATVPANTLSTGNVLRGRISVDFLATIAGNNATTTIVYGSTTIATITVTGESGNATKEGYIDFYVKGGGSTSSQEAEAWWQTTADGVVPTTLTAATVPIFYHSQGTASEDSTQAKTLSVNVAVGIGSGNLTFRSYNGYIEIIN